MVSGTATRWPWYRVDEARFGLPLAPAVVVRLRALRLVATLAYVLLLLAYPTTIRDAPVATWYPAAIIAWVVATSSSLVWREEGRRSALVVADFVLVAIAQSFARDVVLSGSLPTVAVVALGALPPVVTRRAGPPAVAIVALALLQHLPVMTAAWLTGITAAVVVMMERARHESALAWLQAARSAAYMNRLHRSSQAVAERIAAAAEQGRPIAHDITGSVGSIGALGRRLDRDGTTPLVVDLADRLADALIDLRRRLEHATEFAEQHLSAVVPQAGPPQVRVGWPLGGIRLKDAIAVARIGAILGFVVLTIGLHDDLVSRGLAAALAVSAVAVSIPMGATTSAHWWPIVVRVNDSVAIVVAIALVDGLVGPVAPALVIHAALISLTLRTSQALPVVLTTWVGLVVLGLVEGTVASTLLAIWWCLAFATSLQWLLELQRRIVTERRQIAELERGRATAQRVQRGASRLARDLDDAFVTFANEARRATTECRAIAGQVVELGGRSARVGEVLVAECDHLLDLLADLHQRSTAEDSPLVLRRVGPASIVVAAAGVAVTEGTATVVDRTGGAEVVTDPHAIEVCVRNLVSNALRHRLQRPVLITVAVDGGQWSVSVADDGPGLDAAEFDRLTHKYVQAAGDLNTGTYGLGLWIVRSAVERLGGRLVGQRAGGWFVVTFELPIEPPAAGPRPSIADRSEHDQ